MRIVKISAPEGKGNDIITLAFESGIKSASVTEDKFYDHGKKEFKRREIVDLQISTPEAKRFIDALMKADFYDRQTFSISTRQPLSIVSDADIKKLTLPLPIPETDIFHEFWQFSHITVSFVGRVFIAGCLLAFGMINYQILVIVAGMLFLPMLPLLLGISFGSWTKEGRLVLQSFSAFTVAIILLVLAGMAVAAFSSPPLKFTESNPLFVSVLLSLAVGVAAVLANVDDIGKRELIGLAATSQIAIIPVWFGVCFVFGFPATASGGEIMMRALTFVINIFVIVVVSFGVYGLMSETHAVKNK